MELPVRLPVRIALGIDPAALLETRDANAGAGKHPGDGGARRAGADHEHVDPLAGGHGRGHNSSCSEVAVQGRGNWCSWSSPNLIAVLSVRLSTAQFREA